MKWSSCKRQSGQSLAGFLVLSTFVLVPFFIGMTYVAKVGETQNRLHEAARYGSWERTVWKSGQSGFNDKNDVVIGREISARIFTPYSRVIDTKEDQKKVKPSSVKLDSMLYTAYSGKSRTPFLQPVSETGGASSAKNALSKYTGRTESYTEGIKKVYDTAARGFGLSDKGMQFSLVQAEVVQVPQVPITEKVFNLESRNVLYSGTWNANGPSDVNKRVRRVVPTSWLDNGVVNTLLDLASFGFKELGELEFGIVNTETVPCQRVAGTSAKVPSAC